MNGHNMLVSVIVPMYNVENYIKQCVDSIINQTYSNIEIILINDGSPDKVGIIADSLALLDKRIRVIHVENKGVSSARNLGLDIAVGEYIVFVDSDDYLSFDFVEYMMGIVVQTNAEFVMSKNCFTFPCDSLQIENDKIEIWDTVKAASELLYPDKIEIGCWNKMFNKEFLLRERIKFSENFYMGEGLIFIVQVAQLSNFIGVGNRKVYHYRKDNLSSATTVVNIPKYINAISAIDHIYEERKNNESVFLNSLFYHKYLTTYLAFHTILIINKSIEYKDEYNRYKVFLRKGFIKFLRSNFSWKIKCKFFLFCITPRFTIKLIGLIKKLKLNRF